MLKRIWVLAGTVTLSLAALLSLIWLISSSPPVAHAGLAKIPHKSTTDTPPHHRIKQVAAQNCIEIDSDIAVSTTWTASCYRIMTSTVTVYDGAVLTIAPDTSTRVEFQDGAQLQVLGNLQALGAATRPITFTSVNTTSPGRGDWIGIILEDDGGGDVIQYSTIEYANTGVKVNDEDDVSIVSNTFRYNGGSGSTSGAIGGDIDSSHIANNRIHSCTNGMALTEAGHNTIISNTIEDMDRYGILLFEGGVGGGRDNDIVDNVIDRCTRGGLRLEAGDNNRVFSNTIYLNPGGGIHLDEQALTSVQHNYVYSNGGGSDYRAAVLITNTTFLSDISHNVVYDEYAEAIEYDDNNGSIGGPMASNALCSIPSFELRNGVAAAIDAPTNWWSTNTPTDSVSGLVDFTPWIRLSLAGTADGGITVALQDPSGNTVPPTAHRLTDPPAPNARRIELASNWGTLSPAVVLVNDAGTATSTLLPEATPGPDTIVITVTDFCGYPVTATIELPNLAITKTAAVTQVAAGDVLTYLISYANTGGGAATDVRITDTLPAGTVWAGDTAPASGWTRVSTAPPTWFTPTLSPGAHGSFVLSVTVDPTACGLSLTNWVTIGTSILETRLDDNVAHSAPVTVVCTDLRLYVANRHSGTVDVFNTTDFDHVKTISVGANPYGMAASGDHLFVADFAEDGAHGSMYAIDLLSDTVIASTGVGAHPVHIAAYDGHVYVAGHSGPPPITVIRADPPWDIAAKVYLDRHLTYEFGFFGATADKDRGCVYLTKPDFGSEGIWRMTPVSDTWELDYVYPTDEAPRSILYHPTTDRVYAVFGYIDELWVFDPDSWELLERISTGRQDTDYPGYSGHGLAALGQCVFVSNYRGESVTAVVDGSCVERPEAGPAALPAGPYRVYLPLVGRNFTSERRVVAIPVSGHPEGMAAIGNLLFVTLSHEDRVAIINTETLTVIDEIHTQGDYPHTAILAGGNYLNQGP